MTPTSDTKEPQFAARRTHSHNFNMHSNEGHSNYKAKKQKK
jgi:hypothetical protein